MVKSHVCCTFTSCTISDSLDHRAKVRQALASDASWIANYFGKILPMMTRQENSLLVPNGEVNLNQQDLKGLSFTKFLVHLYLIGNPVSIRYNLWYECQ